MRIVLILAASITLFCACGSEENDAPKQESPDELASKAADLYRSAVFSIGDQISSPDGITEAEVISATKGLDKKLFKYAQKAEKMNDGAKKRYQDAYVTMTFEGLDSITSELIAYKDSLKLLDRLDPVAFAIEDLFSYSAYGDMMLLQRVHPEAIEKLTKQQ